MPVTLPCDHPTLVVLSAVFGSHYGVIRGTIDGQPVVAPVAFHLPACCGDYQVLYERTLRALLVPGMTIAVQAQDVMDQPQTGLVSVDILLDGSGRTVADLAISRGWAVPSWPCSPQAQQALAWARQCHAGIWAETGVSAARVGVVGALERETAPPPAAPHAAVLWGCLAVLLGALSAQTAVRPAAAAHARVTGVLRLPLALGRWYGSGLLRPRPGAQPPERR